MKNQLNIQNTKSEYKIKVTDSPLKGIRVQSETPGRTCIHYLFNLFIVRLNGAGRPSAMAQSNIFNGIERIDFKDPSKSQTIGTGRSRNHAIKGFENKYFRISQIRSTSPTAEDHKMLDDEDDYNHPDDY